MTPVGLVIQNFFDFGLVFEETEFLWLRIEFEDTEFLWLGLDLGTQNFCGSGRI